MRSHRMLPEKECDLTTAMDAALIPQRDDAAARALMADGRSYLQK